jgi:hypothetical protein
MHSYRTVWHWLNQGSTTKSTEYKDYVSDPKGVLERLCLSEEEEEENRKRQAKALWVVWFNHPAREILMEDLERGGWFHGLEWDARIVFDAYQAKLE